MTESGSRKRETEKSKKADAPRQKPGKPGKSGGPVAPQSKPGPAAKGGGPAARTAAEKPPQESAQQTERPAPARPEAAQAKRAEAGRPAAAPPERGEAVPEQPAGPRVPARLKERYRKDAVPRLRERFRYRNVMEVPRLEKVVINMRAGDATTDPRFLDKAVEELTLIAGQRPAIARARKSIAAFKLRRGIPIAAKVTLRGDRMYEFVDKLFSIALPRIKDFKGISERQFDGRGNLNIGVREQLIFPEIEYDKVEKVRGMDITLVTSARTDEEARELLRLLGLPLREAGAA